MKKTFEVIRYLREDRDLKQKDVADYLQISRTTYNHYELGHTALTADIIIKLSKLYDVTPNVILNYENKNEINDISMIKLKKLIESENINIDNLILLLKYLKICINSYPQSSRE